MVVPLRRELADALAREPHPRLTVVRAGGLGDTLLILPTLQLLAQHLYQGELAFIGSAWAEQLWPIVGLREDPGGRRLLRFDSPQLTPMFGPAAQSDPTGAFSQAHAAVLYVRSPGDVLLASARRFCRGPVVDWPVEPTGGEHAAVHLARAVAQEPITAQELPTPALEVPPSLARQAQEWLRKRCGPASRAVALHPGSGGLRKCWPVECFAALAEQMEGPVVLLEGPADREPCRRLEGLLAGPKRPARASGLSLPAVAALIAQCRLYVGNDSGLTHLSAALGVATVAIFGPTDPMIWAPLGPRVTPVAVGDASAHGAWPPVEEVLMAAEQLAS
jgi:heptosyltransferase-2